MTRLPVDAGLSMPARYAPHARTWIAWPDESHRWSLEEARREHAEVVRAIAPHEPVSLVVQPGGTSSVSEFLEPDPRVELVEIPIDGAWIRDNGPIFVTDGKDGVALVNFRFNGWGGRYPYALDDEVPKHIAEALGMRCYDAPFSLEGGGFSVDGEGTLVATEQYLLNPNRNEGWTHERLEAGLRDYLGVTKVIWLGRGLVEDRDTDGHSDNVVQFIEPGAVLLQTVSDPDNPNFERCQENRRRLADARDARGRALEIVEIDLLPYTEPLDNPHDPTPGPTRYPVPYVNYYPVNGALIVPMLGGADDEKARLLLQQLHPDREIVGVPSTAMAADGGGVGCVTQQQPAGSVLG